MKEKFQAMTGFLHKSSRAFCTALIFLLAVVIHILFFSIFRPMEAKDARRSQKKRYTVMYQPDLHKGTDPLKLGYWFRIDSGAAFAEPSFRTGYSGMVPPREFREKNLLPPAENRKKKSTEVFFPVSPVRRGDELQAFSPVPLAMNSAGKLRERCGPGEGCFTDCSGFPIPGWKPEKIVSAKTGNGIVLLSVSAGAELLPPDVQVERSSGSPAFDRMAKALLIRRLLKESSRRKGTSYFVFETGSPTGRKELQP